MFVSFAVFYCGEVAFQIVVRSVLGRKGIDLVEEMKSVIKASKYEVKPYVHISAILFVCLIMIYSLTTIFIHIYSACKIH